MTTVSIINIQDHISTEIQDSISSGMVSDNHHGVCAICLNKIVLQETALVKGCEHAYCATCILRWATYKQNPTCPQCKQAFEFLILHRSLDGSIHDCMLEESVCLLLRATWFEPVPVNNQVDSEEEEYNYSYFEEDEDDELDEMYFNNTLSLTIGNRRWGDGGYIRTGRRQAKPKPVYQPLCSKDSASSSSSGDSKKNEAERDVTGRRAKRALKREAADKAAAAKHQNHLVRLGRK